MQPGRTRTRAVWRGRPEGSGPGTVRAPSGVIGRSVPTTSGGKRTPLAIPAMPPGTAHVHAGQPSCCPSTRGRTSATRPAVTSRTPTRSMSVARSERDSGTSLGARSRPAAATGRLTRNIVRHPRPATSSCDQSAAYELAAGGGDAHDHPVDADRPGPVRPGEDHAQEGKDAGADQSGRGPLKEPGADQDGGTGSEPAQGRGEGEQSQPTTKDSPPPEAVPQAPGHHHQHGKSEAIAGQDPFDGAAAGVQARLHGRQGHVDGEKVKDDHHGPRHEDQERPPVWPGLGGSFRGAPGRPVRGLRCRSCHHPRASCNGRVKRVSAGEPRAGSRPGQWARQPGR